MRGGYDTNGDGSISPAETRVKGVFLSVKGPELLNKYVGESERLIRLIFQHGGQGVRVDAIFQRQVVGQVMVHDGDGLIGFGPTNANLDVETPRS